MEEVLAAIYGFVVGKALPFIVLIGLLILVHELGHFTVAKLFKIEVERFSIGFGPKIFGWMYKGTEYRVAWIPLGGYVKMKGDDPSSEVDPKTIPGSFLGAAVWKRILVVLAGPGVNLIVPIFVLAVAAGMGHPVRTSYIGSVRVGTPAEDAGIQPGDKIVEINGTKIDKWEQLTSEIGNSTVNPIAVSIERAGERIDLTLETIQIDDKDLYGSKIKRSIIGISHTGAAPVVSVSPGIAEGAGLETGDRIVKVNGNEVTIWEDFEQAIASAAPGALTLTVLEPVPKQWYQLRKPPGKQVEHTLELAAVDGAAERFTAMGVRRGDIIVEDVAGDGPLVDKLKPGDRLLEVDGAPITDGIAFTRWMEEFNKKVVGSESETPPDVTLTVMRGEERVDITATPAMRKSEGFLATDQEWPWLGFAFVSGSAQPGHLPYRPSDWVTIHERISGIGPALAAGVRGTGAGIYRFYELASRLVSGRASVRENIGGPLAIGYVAGLAAERGLVAFLLTIAELSIILGVMNLLPIPVLDGGHLFFFSAEAVMGRPPSLRVREVAQQVGLVLLLALMVFVMFNDVTRFF